MMIHKESRMCFLTVADKAYQKYVPWFLYFLNRAYPNAHKLVLLDEDLADEIKPMIALLSGNFEIRSRAFTGYTCTNANTIKCLRWLYYDTEFDKYDCMSIGDVDMAIYVENPSYMDQHIAHCNQLQIPYSNFIRPPQSGPRRMGGIHVIQPQKWFTSIRPLISKYLPLLRDNKIYLETQGFNEQLLLRMITESDLGEPPVNLSETYWRSMVTSNHHGTHIRLAECGGIIGLQGAKGYFHHKQEILAAIETSLFKQLAIMSPQIGIILTSIAKAYKNL